MRRLRAANNEVALSLFPFLAVLICTMGALIALLVVVVRNAKAQADEIATATDAQQAAERERLQAKRDQRERLRQDHLWRVEVLSAQRDELAKQLEGRRLELSHLEEHHRRLKEQMEQKLAVAASFDELEENGQQNQQALQAELARLREAVALAEQALAGACGEVEAAQRSYALLPYDGPNGTRRRPIYVECTQEAVIIQPEGIALSPRDFSGPLGAGNPLDAALRAAREYMAVNRLLAPGEEPYPLLVVRPGGSISYAAARAAMTSWDNEFGYELIDAEMQLAYGEADQQRALVMAKAVDESRQRTDMMRSAAPARFEGAEIFTFAERPLDSDLAEAAGGLAHGGASAGTRSGVRPGGLPAAGPGQYSSEFSGRGTRQGTPGNGHRAGEATQPAADARSDANDDSAAGGQSAGGQGGAPSGAPQFPQRLANTRGANWALEGAAPEATGYNRPISVICHADRLEFPATSSTPMQTIPFLGATGNAVGPLVDSVKRRVQSWGIAGGGAYWKPVLLVDVQAGADGRFRDLTIFLDRSGVELERK